MRAPLWWPRSAMPTSAHGRADVGIALLGHHMFGCTRQRSDAPDSIRANARHCSGDARQPSGVAERCGPEGVRARIGLHQWATVGMAPSSVRQGYHQRTLHVGVGPVPRLSGVKSGNETMKGAGREFARARAHLLHFHLPRA